MRTQAGLRWWQLFAEIPRRERDPLGTLRRWHAAYGPRVRIPVRSPSSWSLTDPDDIRHILVANNDNYRKVGWLTLGRRFLGDGLLTSHGSFHAHQRTVLQPAFHRSEIQQMADTIVDETDRAISGWRDGSEINISHSMARLTLATVGRSFVGRRFDDVADDLLEAFLVSQQYMARLSSFLPDSIPTPKTIRYRRATEFIDRVVGNVISNPRSGGIPALLLSARGMDGNPMERRLIRDEIVTLLWAGHETACNALEWGCHLLSTHPEIQAKLHREIDEVLEGRRPTSADVPALRYAEMVFAEILRMYPPAWILARWTIDNDRFSDGQPVPAGSIAFISPYAVHHDPRWFPEPDRFDPDRFHPARRAERPTLSYFPFGAGKRVCIGEHFGRLEGILILVRIAQRFRLHPVAGHTVRPYPLLTLRMQQDLRLIIEQRVPSLQARPCLHTTAS